MADNIKILKLIGEVPCDKVDEITSSIKNIKGVLDCIIDTSSGKNLLKYAIDEWSSDYDVMVKGLSAYFATTLKFNDESIFVE